jgi:hypothetical protein
MASRASRPAVGDLVTYRHEDVLTGRLLTGAAVVYDVSESGGITIAPLSDTLLLVDPSNIAPVGGDVAAAVTETTTTTSENRDQ